MPPLTRLAAKRLGTLSPHSGERGGSSAAMSRGGGPAAASASKRANTPRHPGEAEAGGLGRRRVEAGGERQPKHHARVGGVDDAVVPNTRGGVIGMALTLVLRADRRFERFVLRGSPSAALRFGRLLAQ